MPADTLNFQGILTPETKAAYYEFITFWLDANIDNQMARRLLDTTPMDAGVEEFPVGRIDLSTNTVVPGPKNTPGLHTSIGADEIRARVFSYGDGFDLNENDVNKYPAMQSDLIQGITAKIFRGEDYTFYKGVAKIGIDGFETAARANANGKITAAASNGVDTANNGAWLTDPGRDIRQDILNARGKLRSKFRNAQDRLWLVGNSETLDALDQQDPNSTIGDSVADSVAQLLGRPKGAAKNNFCMVNDQISTSYVYLMTSKNPEFAKMVETKAIFIDDRYGLKPIGNYSVEIYEWVGMAIRDNEGVVEIDTT